MAVIDCPKCGQEVLDDARFCTRCGQNLVGIKADLKRKDTYISQVLEGKYLVLEHLGDGGMGKVYKAEQLTLNKIVAIKILHRNLLQNETQVKRFQREAWSASRLDHPNSIGILDFGQTEDNSHFIAMEYLQGKELSDVIENESPMPDKRIVHILGQVLSVLHEAHDNKIIHRDLKPENIMLIRRAEEEDFVKVLDFGIAKLQERDPNQPALTMQGIVCGTPEYMSPEQAMGKELDHRTDIYSAGCILYEMLTGHVPFEANNYQAILGMHIREDPRRPSVCCPDRKINRKLEEIALVAMQKNREMRFEDAVAMKRALEVALRSDEAATPGVRVQNKGGRTVMMGADDVQPLSEGASEQVTLDAVGLDMLDHADEMPPPSPVQRNTLEGLAMEEPETSNSGADMESIFEAALGKKTTEPIQEKEDSNAYSSLGTSELEAPLNRSKLYIGAGVVVLLVGIVAAIALLMAPETNGGDVLQASDPPPVSPAVDRNEQEEKTKPETQQEKSEEKAAAKDAATDPATNEGADKKGTTGASQQDEPDPDPEAAAEEVDEEEENSDETVENSNTKSNTKSNTSKKKPELSRIERQKLALEYYEKGNAELSKGEYIKALRYYHKSEKYNPNSPNIYKKLGVTYMKAGYKRRAKKYIGLYIKRMPHAQDAARYREIYNSL